MGGGAVKVDAEIQLSAESKSLGLGDLASYWENTAGDRDVTERNRGDTISAHTHMNTNTHTYTHTHTHTHMYIRICTTF